MDKKEKIIKMGKEMETKAELLEVGVHQADNGDNIPYMVFKSEEGKTLQFAITTSYYNKLRNENTLAAGVKGKLVYSKGIFGSKYLGFTPGA